MSADSDLLQSVESSLDECSRRSAKGRPESTRPALRGARRLLLFATRSLQQGKRLSRRQRRLRVVETVSLGEKRFVSILEVDGQSFLLGGGSGSVSMLTQLPGTRDLASESPLTEKSATSEPAFEEVLHEAWRVTA